jgi:hypothetical protein
MATARTIPDNAPALSPPLFPSREPAVLDALLMLVHLLEAVEPHLTELTELWGVEVKTSSAMARL